MLQIFRWHEPTKPVYLITMSAIGSDSWINADEFESGDELHNRATDFVAKIDWEALTSLASKLRDGINCHVSDKFSLGQFNMVRRIVFEDGTSWVSRLRLPELKSVFGHREALDVRSSMQVEIATMAYLRYVQREPCDLLFLVAVQLIHLHRAKTSVPVPEVFSHDLDEKNSIGAPYILMGYINGNVAEELRNARGCEFAVYGTAPQNERFSKQMASVQVQLAYQTFNQIGSLYQDGDGFKIGPELETGQGPWNEPDEYYTALASHALSVAESDAPPEARQSKAFALPNMFPELMRLYGTTGQEGPFSLVNRDFGAHNVLVDDEFSIVGVIDFDGVMAAPIEKVAQFPLFMGLERPIPGHVETRPKALELRQKRAPLLERYCEYVKEAAAGQAAVAGQEKPCNLAEHLLSDAASISRGLDRYGAHQKDVNERWLAAYEMFMRNKKDN